MRQKLLILPVLAAALLVAGCGNDVPSNGVAKIGDTVITKASFNHWLTAAAKGQQAPGQAGATSVPDPPNFPKCIAAKAKQPVPKGAKKPTPAQVKDQCKQEFTGLKDQVMQFLISAEWIQQEAAKRDIEATPAEVQKRFGDQKKQSFPTDKAYQQFLKTSGQSQADLLFRVKLDVLTNEVRQKIVGGQGKVTDQDIEEYYKKNKARFSQPERRDLLVVLTKTESQAKKGKQALEKGTAFKKVAKKFSIDDASKAQGGKLPGVAKGQQEKAFDAAIFKAPKAKITGPVKTQFGYYVFEVTKVTPMTQQPLAKSSQTIKNLLKSQREQKALDSFIKSFQKNYKGETQCAKDYVIMDCENAPKPKTPSGPASGGAPGGAQQVPQGAPPQGAPPQGAPPQGAPPQGAVPQGAAPPQGAPPQGAPPQGGGAPPTP